MTQEEFDELQFAICPSTGEDFDIRWDDDYQQYGFDEQQEEEIEEWLKIFRSTGGDVDSIQDIRNYNL